MFFTCLPFEKPTISFPGLAGIVLRPYADDTTQYVSDVSPMVLQFVINSDLSVLSRWFRKNFLQINAAKTQAIAIGTLECVTSKSQRIKYLKM